MDDATFNYILSNQQKWAEEYKMQQKKKLLEFNKMVREKEWYGNSKEYRRLWDKGGAMFHK